MKQQGEKEQGRANSGMSRIPGYFAGIPGEFRVLPCTIFLITAEKSPTTTTKE
jgi:hypothetical protein